MSGLRMRLVAAVGAIVVVTLAVAFLLVYQQTGTELRAQLDTTLRGSALQLAAAIRSGPQSSQGALTVARRFARAQPYSTAAVLLYAIVPEHGTASNYPELFGSSKPDDDESAAEQRRENQQGRLLAVPRPGFTNQPAPDTGLLRTYELAVRLSDGRTVYAGAAEPVAGIARAQHGVRKSYLLAGILGLALALAGALVAGGRIAAPLRRAAATAARVDGGDLSPRMHVPRTASREIQVLASAFNHMLDRLHHAFDAQRQFVADASHELRTPLTVIRGQLDLLAAQDHPDAEELARAQRMLQGEVARMSRLTDDLLLLAQSREADFLTCEPLRLAPFIEDLWDGLSLTAERDFQTGPVPELTVNADPDRLAQALRNLGRNAIAHTHAPDGIVRIDVESLPATHQHAARVRFTVSDDGPGIPPAEREQIFERFYRIDPGRTRAAGGAGLGLAIVRAIAEAHGGSVSAGERPGGGAALRLELPF